MSDWTPDEMNEWVNEPLAIQPTGEWKIVLKLRYAGKGYPPPPSTVSDETQTGTDDGPDRQRTDQR